MDESLIAIIKDAMLDRDINQAALASMSGISKATISRILSGKQTNNTQDTLDKILKSLDIDLSKYNRQKSINAFIENNDVRPIEFKQVKILGSIRAGVPMMVNENYEGEIKVSKEHLSPGKLHYALKVQGDSMDKEFPEGTIVIVEKTDIVENGDIAVVGINGNEATVKKIQFMDDSIVLIPLSNNPKHMPVIRNFKKDDVHIFGKIVQATKYY